MKKILLATVGVGVIAVTTAALGFAQPSASTGATSVTRAEVAAPLPKLPANIKARQRFDRRRQVRRAAVRLHQRPGQERRLRRRDREVVRPLRVRP